MNSPYQSLKNTLLGGPLRVLGLLRGMDPSQMWGRVYDLRKKKLVALDGFQLYVMPDDYIGHSILKARTYEPHVTSVVRKTLKAGDVFLDVGANVGYFTLLAASLVEGGKVIAVEPNPQNLQLLYSSLLENGSTNVRVHPYAASDQATILRFTTVGSNGGVVTEHAKSQEHFLLVPALRLDDLLAGEARLDLMKIDIEAHEPAAIRGMETLIRRLKPKLITEFHPWAMQLNNVEPPAAYLEQIYSLGYDISIIQDSGDLLPAAGSADILAHWASLGRETAHLDLFAVPR